MPILETIQQVTPASLFMLYGFLPLLLVVFYKVSKRRRVPVLVVGSFLYVLLVQPMALPFLFLSVGASYGACALLHRLTVSETGRKGLVIGAVAINLGIFVLAGTVVQLRELPMLLGSTVYPLMALHGVISCYDGRMDGPFRFWDFALECVFFPKLYAGPFTQFTTATREQVEASQITARLLLLGMGEYIRGFAKSQLLGGLLWGIFLQLRHFTEAERSLLSGWVYLVSFALALYYIIAGYLQMTRGIGKLFGISFPESMGYPYMSDSIQSFTRRFHTSWQRFVTHYVYQPLLGNHHSFWPVALATIISYMTLGLWFGFTFNYAVWGGLIGLFILLEAYVYPKVLERAPHLLRRLYVFVVVLLSFPVLTEESLGESLRLYRYLFSWSGNFIPLYNNEILYIISSNWLLLLVALVLMTGAVAFVASQVDKVATKLATGFRVVGTVLLLGFVTVLMV